MVKADGAADEHRLALPPRVVAEALYRELVVQRRLQLYELRKVTVRDEREGLLLGEGADGRVGLAHGRLVVLEDAPDRRLRLQHPALLRDRALRGHPRRPHIDHIGGAVRGVAVYVAAAVALPVDGGFLALLFHERLEELVNRLRHVESRGRQLLPLPRGQL